MKKTVLALTALGALFAAPAFAGGTNFSIGFYSPAPVYYEPVPVYYHPPVVRYTPYSYVYYGPRHYYKHHHHPHRKHASWNGHGRGHGDGRHH